MPTPSAAAAAAGLLLHELAYSFYFLIESVLCYVALFALAGDALAGYALAGYALAG